MVQVRAEVFFIKQKRTFLSFIFYLRVAKPAKRSYDQSKSQPKGCFSCRFVLLENVVGRKTNMLAYVKYDDGYRAVLPDRLIKGFAPKDAEDFCKSKKVQAHWRSEDGRTEGFYPATVHALAGK